MKKLLGIIVISLSCCSISEAGVTDFFKKLFTSTYETSGCAYDEFGRKIECVTIEYGEGGLTYDQATDSCINYLRRFVNLDVGSIGGCI